jgi:transposase-like protein
MDDLSRFCCQNTECPNHGKRGGKNLSVCDHYGPNQERRMLRCKTCKTRFSERRGTVFFGSPLPEEKVHCVLEPIDEGCGVRKTGRKVRKTYCFSKDWDTHNAVIYFTSYTYNFCWPVRTLRQRSPDGQWLPRTPAMAAGLTDRIRSLSEWLTYPAVQYG